jgi:hypothetical protein
MELYNPALGILLLAVLLASAVILMLAFVLSFNGNERPAWRIVKACGSGRSRLWRGFVGDRDVAPDIGDEGSVALLR